MSADAAPGNWSRHLPAAVVTACGAASLSIEICASRLLAPYFGSSTVVWANVIGLILVYLAAGYWIGGRIADRHPSPRVLGALLVAAALTTAALPFVAHAVLSFAVAGLNAIGAGVAVGSFFGTLVLFAVPVALLGTASPFALRLALLDVASAGRTAGRLSSLGTLGALAGTFASALLLIPAIGTQRTLLTAALLVALLSVPLVGARAILVVVLVTGLIAVPPGLVKPGEGVLAEQDSVYQFIQVVREPTGQVVLRTDEGVADQSVYRQGASLTGGEWDMPLVVPPLLPSAVHRVLVLGNAGGTTARALAATYPGIHIDGVEIDPDVTALADKYLAMSNIPGLHVITADARQFVASTSQTWALIVVDSYRQTYIPFHLATAEFFALLRRHLTPGGAIALNVERVPGDSRLAAAIAGTLATQVPQVWVWPALRFNELVVGLTSPLTRIELDDDEGLLPATVASLAPLVAANVSAVAPATDPLTDDRAPVEWLTDRAVLAYIAGGGRLEEQLLPTQPG